MTLSLRLCAFALNPLEPLEPFCLGYRKKKSPRYFIQRGLCQTNSRKDLVEFNRRIEQSRLTLDQKTQNFSFLEVVQDRLKRLN